MARQEVVSREYKVMLRADKFAGSQEQVMKAASAFWRDFKKTVGGIAFDTDGDLAQIKDRRLIQFYDTAKHHMNTRSYIFRERRGLEEGGRREVTLKFRHPDRNVAQDRNMDARDGHEPRTKFEEDIKGRFTSLYSFSTTQRIGDDKELNNLKDIARMFPDLPNRLDDFQEGEALVVVNSFTAHELVLGGASLLLGKSPQLEAECALIVWYDNHHSDKKPVVIESSYRYGDRNEDYNGPAALRAYEIFEVLQDKLDEWVDPKSLTKTAFVYG